MEQHVTKKLLVELLTKSVHNQDMFKEFSDFVLLCHLGDIDYIFESKDVENFFTIISAYLETEKVDKEDRNKFLIRLRDALIKYDNWSEEFLIAVRNYGDIKKLIYKHDRNFITRDVLQKQVAKYCFKRSDITKIIGYCREFQWDILSDRES